MKNLLITLLFGIAVAAQAQTPTPTPSATATPTPLIFGKIPVSTKMPNYWTINGGQFVPDGQATLTLHSSGDSTDQQTSGSLIVGQVYMILIYVAGDDFTNVGASLNATGVFFTATGTTPTTWTNGSYLTHHSYNPQNSGIVVKDVNNTEVFRLWSTDPSPTNAANSRSVFIGANAGLNSVTTDDVAVGWNALSGGSFYGQNVAIGSQALASLNAIFGENTAVGFQDLKNDIDGYSNTALGNDTGTGVIHGQYNTFLGDQADIVTGDDGGFATAVGATAQSGIWSVALGFGAVANSGSSGSIAIGYNVNANDGEVSLGNQYQTKFNFGNNDIYFLNGVLYGKGLNYTANTNPRDPPQAGDTCYDCGFGQPHLYVYNGSAWKQLAETTAPTPTPTVTPTPTPTP